MTAVALSAASRPSEPFCPGCRPRAEEPAHRCRSTAEALAYAKSTEQQQELVRQIQGELKRLNKLITDVSNASRLDAELALQETEPVDMREILHGVSDVFRDNLGGGTRRIVLEIAEPVAVSGGLCRSRSRSASWTRRHHLLDNAISFSPENGVVMVRARRVGPEIEIVVETMGRAFRRQARGHLQALLFRSAADRSHGRQELGLGLSISREIVQGLRRPHLGDQSPVAPGAEPFTLDEQAELRDRRVAGVAGSRFTVRLPAADATPARGAPPLVRRS
jgi:two-component system sensor histidine kinase ChvG